MQAKHAHTFEASRGLFSRILAASTLAFGLTGALAAAAQSLPSANLRAVPTYESVGLYFVSPGTSAGCKVQFRVAGTSAWTQGLDLWFDGRDNECRGSLVNLAPN